MRISGIIADRWASAPKNFSWCVAPCPICSGFFLLSEAQMENSGSADQKRGRGRPMGKLHQEDVRKKIQVGQLLKTLEDHALNETSADVSLSRMKAIEILLRKSLPDLSSVTLNGPNEDGSHTFRVQAPWLQQQIQARNSA